MKKLLVFDIEGTLFKTNVRLPSTTLESTVWQAIAKLLGPDAIAAEIETHRRWERQEYVSYLDWMKETIEIHKRFNLSRVQFQQVISSAEYNRGVPEVLKTINRNKFEIVLISGGFRELAARVQQDFQIHHAFAACEYFFDASGTLSSYNLLPCDFHGKLDFVRLMLREYKLCDKDWMFIGDGANDVEIAKAAAISIAYNANSRLQEVATHSIDEFARISEILKLNGN